FSSPETLARFRASPTKFAAVEGGACGRMGALSGLGDARRSVVHDGRLYFFASDGCRDTFLKAPARFIAAPDVAPTGTADAQQAGLAAVDRWIASAGGANAVRAATRIVQRAEVAPSEANDHWKTERVEELAWAGDDVALVSVETWTKVGDAPKVHRYETGMNSSGAWQRTGDAAKVPLAPSRASAFAQRMAHLPAAILRARFMPGFTAVSDGEGTIDGTRVDYVKVHFAGATTRLGIDCESGALVTLSYRDRDPRLVVADVTRRVTQFAESNGIALPVSWTTSYVPVNTDGSTGAASSATEPKPATPVTVSVEIATARSPVR
ncbi:MAG: YHS domain-containing protein, partial [Phycisphaerae bacterium]|nr:YHS domain-containing protein [Phycisphaerae bacterium]